MHFYLFKNNFLSLILLMHFFTTCSSLRLETSIEFYCVFPLGAGFAHQLYNDHSLESLLLQRTMLREKKVNKIKILAVIKAIQQAERKLKGLRGGVCLNVWFQVDIILKVLSFFIQQKVVC